VDNASLSTAIGCTLLYQCGWGHVLLAAFEIDEQQEEKKTGKQRAALRLQLVETN